MQGWQTLLNGDCLAPQSYTGSDSHCMAHCALWQSQPGSPCAGSCRRLYPGLAAMSKPDKEAACFSGCSSSDSRTKAVFGKQEVERRCRVQCALFRECYSFCDLAHCCFNDRALQGNVRSGHWLAPQCLPILIAGASLQAAGL